MAFFLTEERFITKAIIWCFAAHGRDKYFTKMLLSAFIEPLITENLS